MLELEDWRALAIGWAIGLFAFAVLGMSWMVPIITVLAAVATRALWR